MIVTFFKLILVLGGEKHNSAAVCQAKPDEPMKSLCLVQWPRGLDLRVGCAGFSYTSEELPQFNQPFYNNLAPIKCARVGELTGLKVDK